MANGIPSSSLSPTAASGLTDGTTANAHTPHLASRLAPSPLSAFRITQRSRSHPSRLSCSLAAASALPKPLTPQRAVSYPEATVALAVRRHRVRIQYDDEKLRERSQTNIRQLLQSVVVTTSQHIDIVVGESAPLTTSEILAYKALKYRRVLERLQGVDVNDPMFDASEFLGVEWCKRAGPSLVLVGE